MENNKIDWDDVTEKNVNELTFEGEEKIAKVVSVHDGDTIKVVFPFYNTLIKWNVRLARIDAPEIKSENVFEQQMGTEVRDKIKDKILGKMVKLVCGKFDKYGRLLAEIYVNNKSINQWLINNKYAFEYIGGTKKQWKEQDIKQYFEKVDMKKTIEKFKTVKKN